jgi:AraC family transcriptional regulator, arabinose operon regulatory protein
MVFVMKKMENVMITSFSEPELPVSDAASFVLPTSILEKVANHPICQILYFSAIGHYARAGFQTLERAGSVHEYIFIYCVHGKGWYRVLNKTYQVESGQFFILPAYCSHIYGADPEAPWSIYWVHFFGSTARSIVNYLAGENQYAPVGVFYDAFRIRLFNRIYEHVERSSNFDSLIFANSCLHQFLISFKETLQPGLGPQNDGIDRVLLFMKKNLHQKISLEALASMAGMSTPHFSAMFKKRLNNSPVNHFTLLKIQHACQLLKTGVAPVKNVAFAVGFDDPYHFSKVFSQTMGISPRQFRQRERGD